VLTDPLPIFEEPLYGLVYCPGSINFKPFSNLKTEDFRGDMEINLFSAIRAGKEEDKYWISLQNTLE
jgi:3-oxoacyl-[acyl-carrier protein] reductase